MQLEEFLANLSREGFEEVVTVTREPHGFLDTHTHAFEAKALILQGELRLQVGAHEHTYRVGEVFHLLAEQPHAEWYGPQGVSYQVGRR
jgi:quercetin dioxygenase-like cupin family protein